MACAATQAGMTPKPVTARSASDEAVSTFDRGDCHREDSTARTHGGRGGASSFAKALTSRSDKICVIGRRTCCAEAIPAFKREIAFLSLSASGLAALAQDRRSRSR